MNNKHIKHITAVTKVFPDGQRCVRAELEYDRPLVSGVAVDTFSVQERTVIAVHVDGSIVTLDLSPEDAAARTFRPGNPWRHDLPTVAAAKVVVTQIKPLLAQDGSPIEPSGWDESDRVRNPVVDDFIQEEFEGLKYNLYIPKDLAAEEKYPLVQFIHDAGPCGPDPQFTLTQGVGAVVWAAPEFQARHKCFVLAPQFDVPSIVDDEGHVDSRLDTLKRLLDHLCEKYPVDRTRLYTTGQSMGCMSSIVLNCRYPNLFAASYLVAGQWSERDIPNLEKARLWMICSVGDAKAFPGMNQIACELESRGVRVARKVIDARASQDELTAATKELVSGGTGVIYTPFAIESVADGWHSRGGAHHVTTWQYAYGLEAAQEWLFAQQR